MEWLCHIGVLEDQIEDLTANSTNTVPTIMPFASAYFMPRKKGDRTEVVLDGAVNFAFLGQFVELPRDTVFTTEYSMRTAMVVVYTLFNVDRDIPEVWDSLYDVRDLLKTTISLRDGRPLTETDMGFKERMALKKILERIENTVLEKLLKEYHVI